MLHSTGGQILKGSLIAQYTGVVPHGDAQGDPTTPSVSQLYPHGLLAIRALPAYPKLSSRNANFFKHHKIILLLLLF